MTNRQITYSLNYPLVLSKLCSNKCGYCDFHVGKKDYLPSKKIILSRLRKASKLNATSIKLIAGEKISEHPSILENIKYYGFKDYSDYLKMTIETILAYDEELCQLPMLDIGVMSITELIFLRNWIFSIRIALESMDSDLMEEIPHRESPTKKPEVRQGALIAAGKAKIPTTTAILLGIGEKPYFRKYAIDVINEIHQKYGHIQAVEINRFRPIQKTPMEACNTINDKAYIKFISEARKALSPDIAIQIDFSGNEEILCELIDAGISDIGDIDTGFESNGSFQENLDRIAAALKNKVSFRQRLPIYDKYLLKGWFPEKFMKQVKWFFNYIIKDHDSAMKIKKCIMLTTPAESE